ncbi:PDZ domain-containing protein [Hydrogenimonas sp.]
MILLSLFSLLFLFSDTLTAESCFDFFPDAYKVVEGHSSYAVAKNRFIAFHCPEREKIVAKDEFEGLCLFESPVRRPFPLADPKPPLLFHPSEKVRHVDILSSPFSIYPGRVEKGFGKEGALFTACCGLVGIVDGEGRWFGRNAMERLLRGETYHGDVGVRFERMRKDRVVSAIDPFVRVPLLPGDRLLKAGKSNDASFETLAQEIDRCRRGKSLSVTVSRDGKTLTFSLKCFERTGGGKVSDTFLERFGFRFDRRLRIVRVEKKGKRQGVREGDRLLQIGRFPVADEADVQRVLTDFSLRKTVPKRLLWERDGFQFFLPLPSL